ncbi:hypothetical protein SLH46_17210 [Draconibacterium sp. IB214405]|uniref:hypothetical protein n=1 Tax=Draconibacterium sp. IB214405 TaxID=3097352 RepID=UPI002A102BA8|nr:hypothetical protein [Draconibacterium sp. IB214405]MDX8340941.1 hypothetical protein [Draconibacterium sp. IB214405]
MKTKQKHTRLLILASGILLISILILLTVLPGAYTKTLPNTNNTRALIGIALAIVLRLSLLFGYVHIIRKIRNNTDVRGGTYILIGVLLLTLGLIDTDGAFAFLEHKDILYVSFLMLASIFCDLTAALLTFIAVAAKPASQQIQTAQDKKLLNGLLIGLGVIVLFFFAFPWGILLSLAFWIYLGITLKKNRSFFSPETEATIVEKLQKRIKGLLTVAVIALPVAIVGIVLHNVVSGKTGGEDSFYFYIGVIAEYIFVLASAGAMVTLLKGRQKQE